MIKRLIYVVAGAAGLVALDLGAKAVWSTPPELLHERSTMWVAMSAALVLACFAIAAVSSSIVAAAAATCAGGLLGNLASAIAQGSVPDPFLLGGQSHGVAFNLADALFLIGLAGLVAAGLQKPLRRGRLAGQKKRTEG